MYCINACVRKTTVTLKSIKHFYDSVIPGELLCAGQNVKTGNAKLAWQVSVIRTFIITGMKLSSEASVLEGTVELMTQSLYVWVALKGLELKMLYFEETGKEPIKTGFV